MKYLLQYLNKLRGIKGKLEKQNQQSLDVITDLLKEIERLGGSILALSKDAINASINNRTSRAKTSLKEAEKKIIKFGKNMSKVRGFLTKLLLSPSLKMGDLQNIYVRIDSLEKNFSDAKEEFFEAKILHSYLQDSKKEILEPEKLLLVDFETYAGALSDFCGELLRKAKLDIIKRPNSEKRIKKYYQDTYNIYQAISNFSFSNKSGIRQKVENLKKYIRVFEDLLYDLSKK